MGRALGGLASGCSDQEMKGLKARERGGSREVRGRQPMDRCILGGTQKAKIDGGRGDGEGGREE